MIPIHLLDDGQKLPKTGSCYVVAANGIFIKKDTGLIKALVPVKSIAGLVAVEPFASLCLPKLPVKMLVRSLLFFRSVWKKWQSEAITLLHYSVNRKKYLLWCPNQEVQGLRIISYDPHERFDDFQLVGTIHSHVNAPASHSGIDHNDEKNFDGVHITLGNVAESRNFSLSASLMVNGFRFLKDPEELIAGLSAVGRQRYDLILPKGKDYRHVPFPRNWLKKVRCDDRENQNHRLGRNRRLPFRQTTAFSGLLGQGRRSDLD